MLENIIYRNHGITMSTVFVIYCEVVTANYIALPGFFHIKCLSFSIHKKQKYDLAGACTYDVPRIIFVNLVSNNTDIIAIKGHHLTPEWCLTGLQVQAL